MNVVSSKKAFIVHGRDLDARAELAKFVVAVGLEDHPFEAVSAGLAPTAFIADIVTQALKRADVVLVLFTPDECAQLYDGKTQRQKEEGRWQSRANVFFEAGVCFGLHQDKTVLVSLGTDTSLFSDINGMHIVDLCRPDAKVILKQRLEKATGALTPTSLNWQSPGVSGDFEGVARRRWRPFDEVEELAATLRARTIVNKQKDRNLLDIVRATARAKDDWTRLRPVDFMKTVGAKLPPTVTDDTYWWLVVYGFFRFTGIDEWFEDGEDYRTSVDEAQFAPRAHALMERLRAGLA